VTHQEGARMGSLIELAARERTLAFFRQHIG
jgi:hypothetical protein